MVAIVSGNSLGLNLTSMATLGRDGVTGGAGAGRNGQLAYVNVANGNLVLQNQDDYLASRGLDAVAVRTYNSQGLLNDDNGDNWSSGAWLQPLILAGTLGAAGSTIQRTDGDGSVSTYTYDTGRNLYVSPDGEGAYDTIAHHVADNRLDWRDGSTGTLQRYEASGAYRLLSSSDTSGNLLTYAYNAAGRLASATSASGETTFYDYTGNNLSQLRTVTSDGATSTRVRYAYDASNRLTSVSVDLSPDDNSIADGKVYQTTYTYEGTSKRIAGITQTDGTQLAFTYIDIGGGTFKIATVRDALDNVTSFTYGAGFSTVTDAHGNVTRYDADAAGRLVRITPPAVAGGATGPAQFTYSVNGDLLSTTDGEGRTVTYGYDANGNQVLQRDHAGNTVQRTYGTSNQLLTETLHVQPDPDGDGAAQPGTPLTTRYIHDGGDRRLLRFVVSAEGRVTEFRYNGMGEQVSSIVYQAGTYPVAGLAVATVPTEADLVAWAGTQDRSATSRVDTAYDARGQVQSRTTYAKVDATGAGVADGTQSVAQHVYDQDGLLLQTVSPTGGTTTYTYDGLGRVLAVTNALGEVSLTQYDDAARRTVLTQANGLVTSSNYDAGGRLVAVVQSSPSAVLGETKYFHDANGRLRMTQDPTGVRSWMLYDQAGRKTADIDGNGTMTEYTYDRNGLVVRVDVWGTAVDTASLVDAGGSPTAVLASAVRPATSAQDTTTWRAYDAANRLVREATTIGTSTSAAVTETRYDGASRIVQVVRYANLVVADGSAGSPSAGSVPLPPVSAQDRITRNFHDADGRLAGTLDAEGYLTTLIYNGAGQLTETLSYATVTDAALRASGTLAQLRPPASGADVRSVTLYDGKGQAVAHVDAEGYLTENVHDAQGNVTLSVRYATRVAVTVTAGSSLAVIRPASDSADRATSRTYDGLGRVMQETAPDGVVTQYAYDAGGNLISTVRAAGTNEVRTLLARYDLQGRLLGELSAQGAALLTGGQTQAQVDAIWQQYGTFHSYDAASRRISSTDPSGARTLFYYNTDGALTHTVNALGEVRERKYDARGRVTEEHVYRQRVATTGLAGGLVTQALTNAVAAIAESGDLRVRYTYTKDGRVETAWDGQAKLTQHTYNAFGDEILVDEGLGGGSSLLQAYAVDRRGLRTATVADPYGSHGLTAVTTTTYDAFGRAIRVVDPMGRAREQSFDRLGRVVSTRDPLNVSRTTSYDAFGRVLTQQDGLGNVTTYAYDRTARAMTVTTPEGVVSTTTYNRHGQVLTLADGKGQVTSYSYDADGHLLQTATPLTTASNAYDTSGRLVETVDAGGRKVVYTYDAAHRVLTRRVDPSGLDLTTTYAYDGKGQQVSVADPNGVATSTEYDNQGQVVRQRVDPAGLDLQTTYTYDAKGNVLSVTAPGGTVTQYVYDALGRRVQERVDPSGLNLQRSWSYDKNGNALSSTDPLGNVTRYAYDAGNRLVFTVDPLGNVKHVSYDAEGRVVRTVVYATPIDMAGLASVPTSADIQARLVAQAGLDVVEHRVYDRDGRMAAAVDGTGAVVRYTYDANGNVVARVAHANRIALASWTPGTLPAPIADPAQDAQQFTVYDALDRAVYSVNGSGAVVAHEYDGNGNVLRRTAYATSIPAATPLTQAGIALAVASVADVRRDATVRNVFDAADRLTWSADGTGAVTQRTYDKNGNVVRQVAYATPVAAAASPSSVTASATDRATSMAYDNANRLVLSVDALNAVIEHVYDADGHVIRQTAYANRIGGVPALGTAGTANAIRALLTPDAAADRSIRYGHDAAGRQRLVIDAMGAAIETRYDSAGHPIQVTSYANPVNTSSLAAVTTLSSMQALVTTNNAGDRVATTAYDSAGRRVYEVDALGAVTHTQYDGAGRMTLSTRYALAIPATTVNTAPGVAAAIQPDAADRTDTFSYNAAGQLVATMDAMGGTESYTYDALGNRLSFTNKKGATWTYTYDASGRMVSETTPQVELVSVTATGTQALTADPAVLASIVTRMSYDALGQLTQRIEAWGRPEERSTRYEYDAVGRQVRVIYPPVGVYDAAADAVTTNGVAGIANRVESTRSLETLTVYDALGNAVANRDVGGALSQKAYDLLGRVAYDVDAMGYVTGYRYDAFGNVTRLTRYGSGTALANGTVTQPSQAATKAQVEAVVDAPSFNHAQDRVLIQSYDRAGRVTEVVEPTAFVYDANLGTGGDAAKTTRNTYDAFGQLVQVQSLRNAANAWSVTTHYYDKAGRQQAVVDALGHLTWHAFDVVGNITETREYANALGAGSWNQAGYGPVVPPTGDDRATRYTYDRLDRKTQETRLDVEYSTAANGTSTRGNLSTTYAYDAVGNQTATTDAAGQTTYTYYDALGRVAAIAAPAHNSTLTGASLTPLTAFRRDAHGNVTVKIDYASGAAVASAAGFVAGAASADDRRTLAAYDSFGRSIQTTNARGDSAFHSYDAHGHVAKSWQGVTGTDGITRTLFEVNAYDKLGQLIETRSPASTTVLQGGLTAAFVPYVLDENDFVVTPHRLTLGWSNLVDPQGGTVRVQVDYMASSTALFDEYGNVRSGAPAHLESVSSEFVAASATGGAEVTWAVPTDGVAYIRITQLSAGQWISKWEGSPAQANGSGIVTLTQAQAGLVYTSLEYNAFGEMTRKGSQGGRQEYFDYDTAGRLWRTNAGDGVDRISLFDAQGNVTSEIRSSGSGRDNIDVKGFANAQAAADNPYTRRVDFRLDALGRVTGRLDAARLDAQGGVVTQRQYTTATVTHSAVPLEGESGMFPVTDYNAVSLSWNSLLPLGSGEVKVDLEYRTPVVVTGGGSFFDPALGIPLPTGYSGGTLRTYSSGVFSSESAATGVNLSWSEAGTGSDVGIGKVSRIVVYKKDTTGIWRVVIDQQPGYGANALELAAPADPAAAMTLELRTAGSTGDSGWWTVTSMQAFGQRHRFDARDLAVGSYEYRVKVASAGEPPRVTASGTVAITQPPLGAIDAAIGYVTTSGSGVLSWLPPPAGTDQVWRYRSAGSTGAWSTLPVFPRNGSRDGVDTSGFAAGTYQFELLWTPAGQGQPTSHAVGTFNVVASVAGYHVPPVNLPHITGLVASTAGSIQGFDLGGQPIYVSGSVQHALAWDAANATVARYRVPGGAWSALTIDNALQSAGESGYTGLQKALLGGVPPGTYEVQILVGSPPTAQATATLVVHPQSGHWESRQVLVNTTWQSTIIGWQPVYGPPTIIGYNESGPIYAPGPLIRYDPIYARDENGNIIYTRIDHYENRNFWVVDPAPAPTVTITTPPYTAGYWVDPIPTQYSAAVSTTPGSTAVSGADGTAIAQSAQANGDARWLRPTVTQKFDRWGNVIEVTDPRSAYWKTTYKYNANNQMVLQTQPDASGAAGANSPVTTIFYDQLARQVAVKDANGNVNGQVFDAAGNLVEERNAYGGAVAHRYDAFGQKVKTTDAEGRIVGFSYDSMGHMLRMDKGVARVYRTSGSNAMEYVEMRSIADSWTYDQLGRKLTQTNGNGETLSYKYDLRGNVVETRQPLGQVLRAAFDAQGRKIAEADANGFASTWTYDYFGQLTAHTDLGGALHRYTYDNARQLVLQTSTKGLSLSYAYDAAGQVTAINDHALNKLTTYVYDLTGRRVRERVQQNGVVYQDNHLAYDALGNLRDVSDARAHVSMEYDKVGNRTRVSTSVGYQGTAGEAVSTSDRYFKYDVMNRQIVVDAVDAAGNIGQQGHEITYDQSGNRIGDRYWGNRVTATDHERVIVGFHEDFGAIHRETTYAASTGYVQELYTYDTLNRLQGVERDGVQVDLRYYDGADRVIQSGPAGALAPQYADLMNQGLAPGETNGKETRINRYDANGRLLHQKILKSDNTAKIDISWDPNETLGGFVADGYDAVGNVRGYVVRNHEGDMTNEYTATLERYDGYRAGVTHGVSTELNAGTVTQIYDGSGFLVGVTDTAQTNNNRSFVNDANGLALYVNQGGRVQRQLVVNGEVLGIYGVGVDPNNPASGSNSNPNFANLVDFDFGYARISAAYPNAAPGAYQVRSGDTLKSIAQSAYGDSALWYRIAEANGLAGDDDMRVGQTLNIPSRVSTIGNNSTTFKPYDPSRIEGSMSPTLPMPEEGCGGIGKVLMVIVAIVVTIATAGALAGATGSLASALSAGANVVAGTAGALGTSTAAVALGSAGTMAVSAAVGSVASQLVGMVTGDVQKFSWKGVALSALSAGVSAGIGSVLPDKFFPTGTLGLAAKMATANAVTQGISVAVGLQKKFDWRGVAASAAGAVVGDAVGKALGLSANGLKPTGMEFGEFFAKTAFKSLASGLTAAAMKGGKVAIQQVAIDAFGSALGQSLAGASSGTPTAPAPLGTADALGDFIAKNNNWAHVDVSLASQQQRDALYGWSTGNDGLGFKPIDGISIPRMRYQGMVSDDLRTFSDSAEPREIGPVGGKGDSPERVAFLGGLLNPANPAHPLNPLNPATAGTRGYTPIRPDGAGGPPPYDIVRERPSGAPGFAQANPSLGLGAPPQQGTDKPWFDRAIEGMPIGVKAAAGLVQLITTKVGEAANTAPPSDSNGLGVRAYPDGSLRTPDGKFASNAGMPAPGTVNASNYAEFLKKNGVDVVGTELEVDGPLGVRKYDIGTRNPDGTVFGIEIKSGGATKTWYQEITDMYVNRFGAAGRGRIEGQRVTGSMTVYLPPGGR